MYDRIQGAGWVADIEGFFNSSPQGFGIFLFNCNSSIGVVCFAFG